MIQNHDAFAIEIPEGSCGSCLGYDGMPNSLAIEFDTFQGSGNDPNDNHISVHTRGVLPNSHDEAFSIGVTANIPELQDGAVHTAKIVYIPGSLSIFLDDLVNPVLTVTVDLATTLQLDDRKAWAGFTAATGGLYENHDILLFSFSFTASTPQEQILMLRDEVEKLMTAGAMNKGQANALTTKLDGALAKLERGDTTAAANQLHAFVNQVEAFQRNRQLTTAHAHPLMDGANPVIDELRR